MRLLGRLGVNARGSAPMGYGLFAGLVGFAAIASIQTLAVGLVHVPTSSI